MARFGKRGADAESHAEPELGSELAAEPEADTDGAVIPVPDVPAPPTPVPAIPSPAIAPPPVSASVVFHPEPLGDGDDEALGVGPIVPGADPALATAAELEWTIVARTAPPVAVARTALQETMAEIAEKHKDGPIEGMLAPIRAALAAHGREIPEEWILAIAEGLRHHGPISLNLGGPDAGAS